MIWALDEMWSAYRAASYRHERAVAWLITTALYHRLVTEPYSGAYVSPLMGADGEIRIFGLPARRVGSHDLSFVLVTR